MACSLILYLLASPVIDTWLALKSFFNSLVGIKSIVINTQLQRDRRSMHQVRLTAEALLTRTSLSIVLNGRELKDVQRKFANRVFVANQQNMKKGAIIEGAIMKRFSLSH